MSGGTFSYQQYQLQEVIDTIEFKIEKNGRLKTKEELKDEGWTRDSEWYNKYPEDLKHYEYPSEVIEEFKKGVEAIKLAKIYMHEIDYLIAGDTGNESFLKRLKKELCQEVKLNLE